MVSGRGLWYGLLRWSTGSGESQGNYGDEGITQQRNPPARIRAQNTLNAQHCRIMFAFNILMVSQRRVDGAPGTTSALTFTCALLFAWVDSGIARRQCRDESRQHIALAVLSAYLSSAGPLSLSPCEMHAHRGRVHRIPPEENAMQTSGSCIYYFTLVSGRYLSTIKCQMPRQPCCVQLRRIFTSRVQLRAAKAYNLLIDFPLGSLAYVTEPQGVFQVELWQPCVSGPAVPRNA